MMIQKMTRDKIKRKRPSPVQQQQQQQQQQQPVMKTRRSTRSTFTAQDSFASSDEDVDLNDKVEQLHQRRAKVTRRRPAPPTTRMSEPSTKKQDNDEESDDDEYKADSSDHEEDDIETADQNNLMDEVAWLVEGKQDDHHDRKHAHVWFR